jgi:hypothetical protein
VGNWGQDEECRELLAEMVERQLSSSKKTEDLILSLLYSDAYFMLLLGTCIPHCILILVQARYNY